MTKKETTKTNKTEERIAMSNEVHISGIVNRVINKNKYSLKTTKEVTKKDGTTTFIDFFIPFVDFNNEYEVDDKVVLTGYLSTHTYDGKNGKVYETLVNVTDVKEW